MFTQHSYHSYHMNIKSHCLSHSLTAQEMFIKVPTFLHSALIKCLLLWLIYKSDYFQIISLHVNASSEIVESISSEQNRKVFLLTDNLCLDKYSFNFRSKQI